MNNKPRTVVIKLSADAMKNVVGGASTSTVVTTPANIGQGGDGEIIYPVL